MVLSPFFQSIKKYFYLVEFVYKCFQLSLNYMPENIYTEKKMKGKDLLSKYGKLTPRICLLMMGTPMHTHHLSVDNKACPSQNRENVVVQV